MKLTDDLVEARECARSALRSPRLEVLGFTSIRDACEVAKPARATELIALLTLRLERAELSDLAAHIWPDEVKSAGYLHNLVRDARKLLGAGPEGRPRIPLYVRQLRIDPPLSCDWSEFCVLATSPDPAMWEDALALVRGLSFSGVDWRWAIDPAAEIERRVVETACKLARRALDENDPGKAEWAAHRARLAARYDERLYRILMEAAHLCGNSAGVRSALDLLLEALEARDVAPEKMVSPATWDLYVQLTHSTPDSGGAR